MRGLLLIGIVVTAGGCGDERERPEETGQCRFGDSVVLDESPNRYDDLALVATDDGPVAAISDGSGLRLLFLDESAQRRREVRLGGSCTGGIDATPSNGGLLVACVRPAIVEMHKAGGVAVLRVDGEGVVQQRAWHQPAGSASNGVSIVAFESGPVVAWQDAEGGTQRVWLVSPGHDEPRRISRGETLAGAPAVAVHRGQVVAAFTETVYDDDGAPIGEVRLHRGRGAPVSIDTVLYEDARPALQSHDDALLVAFVDERPSGSKAGLHVTRILDDPSSAPEAVRIGRADVPYTDSAVVVCEGSAYTVSPRTFGRWEILVGINRLDANLEPTAGERQIYEASARMPLADAICLGDGLLVVAAEQSTGDAPGSRLRATTLHCD